MLTLRVAAPGDFSIYTLTIPSPVLDQFFNHIRFSFKAGCPSDLDCETPPPPCPPLAGNAPPIDYMAKDFLSFRQALLDFSALRYPSWQERSEADFGVMFLEALSAIADELSYTQDRVATESSLLTATQRRSVIRHARLVDYEPRPAISAKTVLQFDVDASAGPTIKHGLAVIAPAADGTPITFETGLGLDDTTPEPPASPLWNRAARIQAYLFDDSERCLPVGATQMNLRGQRFGFQLGQALLIETAAASSADPPLRQIVHLVAVDEICDPLFLTSVTAWRPANHDLPHLAADRPGTQRSDPHHLELGRRADRRPRPSGNDRDRQYRQRDPRQDGSRRGLHDRAPTAGQHDPVRNRTHRAASPSGARIMRHAAGHSALFAGQRAARLAVSADAGPIGRANPRNQADPDPAGRAGA